MRVSMDLASFELVRNFYDTIMHDVLEAGLLDYGECKQPPRREERRTDLKKKSSATRRRRGRWRRDSAWT